MMFSLRFRRLSSGLFILCLAAGQLLAVSDAAWAKGKKEEPVAAPTKSYVMPYFIVLVGVTFGLIVVLRPAKRGDELSKAEKKAE